MKASSYKQYFQQFDLTSNAHRRRKATELSVRPVYIDDKIGAVWKFCGEEEWGIRDFAINEINSEIKLWKSLEKHEREFFTPILKYRMSQYHVTPLCRFEDPATGDRGNLWESTRARFQSYITDILPLVFKYHLVDVRPSKNWSTLWDGRPIIFDWGQNGYNPEITYNVDPEELFEEIEAECETFGFNYVALMSTYEREKEQMCHEVWD